MAKKKQERGYCIFCGGTPLSKEHIWADWLRDYIPRTSKRTDHNVSIVAGFDFEKSKGKVNRPGDPHSQRLRVVCEACNNGWMSNIQNRVKANLSNLVVGQSGDFSEEGRLLLSVWATMFTYIWEQAEPKLVTSTPEERREFMDKGTPPAGWSVWMCRYTGTRWRGKAWRRAGLIQGLEDSYTPLQTTTFAVGKIAFHTFSSTGLSVRSKRFCDDHHLYEIWPNAGSILSLSSPLDDEDINLLPMMAAKSEDYFGTAIDDSALHFLNSITSG